MLMLGNTRLPGPFSRVPIAWVIAVIVFILAGITEATKPKGGSSEQALLLVALGVVLVLRGAMTFSQRRPTRPPGTTGTAPAGSANAPREITSAPELTSPPELTTSPPALTAPAGPATALPVPAATPLPDASPPVQATSVSEVPNAVIEARDLRKRYEHIVAVDGVSFSVQRGEIFGLLGPNGAGKSTTLEMLEGLRDIDSGIAVVLGTDVTENAVAVKRRIGVQLQATALPSFTTVAESIDLFRAFYDQTRDTADLLVEFDLVPQAKQITTKLSGGQQQRLSIALAMVNDPDVVFLDEPTTGLDPQARIALWDFIERFRARGKTVMLTTHYMEEAERLCDRVAVMDQGRIVALDTPDRLVALHGPGTTITFNSPTPDADRVRALTGVESAEVQDGAVRIVTRTPEVVLAQLLHPDGDQSSSITNLRVERGTLEDVFVALTGRDLRS
jgi:ABC-2 type transport system ATP-binding protein